MRQSANDEVTPHSLIDGAVRAFLAELHRQGEARGVTVEDNGSLAQVDGSFEVRPIVCAIVAALREPMEQ